MIFGEPRRDYETVSSTQDKARDWAKAGAPPGALVTAQAMTAGRGRLGRTWIAPPGANVCFTVVGPAVPHATAWQIALVAGCAVCEALRGLLREFPEAAAQTVVRFPNDVYLADKKVSGILVETLLSDGGQVVPLIGIGVNVLLPETPLPPEIAARAIAFNTVSPTPFDVRTVERAVLETLTFCWNEWQADGFAAAVARWKGLTDPHLRREFIFDNQAVACQVAEISPDGTVTLITPTGEPRILQAAQVIFGD